MFASCYHFFAPFSTIFFLDLRLCFTFLSHIWHIFIKSLIFKP